MGRVFPRPHILCGLHLSAAHSGSKVSDESFDGLNAVGEVFLLYLNSVSVDGRLSCLQF